MKKINYIDPITKEDLYLTENFYFSKSNNNKYQIKNKIPRFCEDNNYTNNFSFQWNKFSKTQIDNKTTSDQSSKRFYQETNWKPNELDEMNILEVGSGAGRFTEVVLRTTKAYVYSVDYSNAVENNYENNLIYGNRLNLSQASIYNLPFENNVFDKVFCFGVLQHTPDFEISIKSLIDKCKISGEIVVDFYSINGWYTKIHSKYFIRKIYKNFDEKKLINLIEKNITWLIKIFDILCYIRLGFLTRFLPITDIRNFPSTLSIEERKEWAILDTFDGITPKFDNPKRISEVVKMFEKYDCKITFANFIKIQKSKIAVVRAIKIK